MEFIVPLIGSFDDLVLVLDSLSTEPLLGGMLHDLLKIFRVDGVEDVEKVGTAWSFIFRVGILEVNLEIRIFLQFSP